LHKTDIRQQRTSAVRMW